MSVALFVSSGEYSFLRKVWWNWLMESHPAGRPWNTRSLLGNDHRNKKGGSENIAAGAGARSLAPTGAWPSVTSRPITSVWLRVILHGSVNESASPILSDR